MKSNKAVHKRIFLHICENLDQGLNSPKCRQIKRHLDACPECIAYLDSLKATITLYRDYPIPRLSIRAKKRLRTIIQL